MVGHATGVCSPPLPRQKLLETALTQEFLGQVSTEVLHLVQQQQQQQLYLYIGRNGFKYKNKVTEMNVQDA